MDWLWLIALPASLVVAFFIVVELVRWAFQDHLL